MPEYTDDGLRNVIYLELKKQTRKYWSGKVVTYQKMRIALHGSQAKVLCGKSYDISTVLVISVRRRGITNLYHVKKCLKKI